MDAWSSGDEIFLSQTTLHATSGSENDLSYDIDAAGICAHYFNDIGQVKIQWKT